MHIYDPNTDTELNAITIYLTPQEASELHDELTRLLAQPRGNHAHLSSADFQREATICIYRKEDIDTFDDRSKEIIKTD